MKLYHINPSKTSQWRTEQIPNSNSDYAKARSSKKSKEKKPRLWTYPQARLSFFNPLMIASISSWYLANWCGVSLTLHEFSAEEKDQEMRERESEIDREREEREGEEKSQSSQILIN